MSRAGTPLRLLASAALAVAMAAGCGKTPKLTEHPVEPLPPDAAPAIALESATVVGGKVQVTFRLEDAGTPITGLANAATLAPNWTLAWLDVEPVSGLPAWRSMIFTGAQIVPSLPAAGPGTPPANVYANQRQPGAEADGTVAELGGGRFTYTFKDALPPAHPLGDTLRVGVFLEGVAGAARTNGTLDFVPNDPSGATLQSFASTSDGRCNGCHGAKSAHDGKRFGVKLCMTCHTWLHADPDTADPAAMSLGADTSDAATLNQRAAVKRATFPNPLEFGRLVHRIHRGRNLPTLYRSASCYTNSTKTGVTQLTSSSSVLCNVTTLPPTFPAAGPPPVPPLPPADLPWTVPALPFRPGRNSVGPGGIKQLVIGEGGRELVIGRIATNYTIYPATATAAEGIGFPQDLRNCAACHDDDLDTGVTVTAISRRTCSGCHPDTWFGPVAVPADLDAFHMPHSGGPCTDDGPTGCAGGTKGCVDCHVAPTGYRKADIALLHKPPVVSPRWKKPIFEIVRIQNLKPGTPAAPGPAVATIQFKASDALGPITPLNNPTVAWDSDPNNPSPVPRKLTSLTLRIGGPNTDYVTGNERESWVNGTIIRTLSWAVVSSTAATAIAPPWQVPCSPNLLSLSADPVTGIFTCSFPNPFAELNRVPGQTDVAGYYTAALEGRRASAQTQFAGTSNAPPAPYDCTATTQTACAAGTYLPSAWPWYGWILGYDPAGDAFRWPGTGETITEGADYAPVSVDLATGEIATSPSAARRTVVTASRCNACHLRFTFHGSQRPDPNLCLFCHAADATEWSRRPRDLRPAPAGSGEVLLSDALEFPATSTKPWSYWSRDGLEERSIQLKTFIHRIHTGEREGLASLAGIEPFGIHTSASGFAALDEVRYPNQLGNCEACHLPGTWQIEAVPSTALPTSSNEEPSLRHHAPEDPLGALSSIATSPDGITWTPRPIDATHFAAVAGNGTVFAAVGASVAASSPDGANWTVRTIATGNWAAVTWGGSLFVAVGTDLVATSPDGITWTKRTIPAGGYLAVAWNGTSYLAVGSDGAAATSPDGITWTKQTVRAATLALPAPTLRGVAWNGTVFAAVGIDEAATSPDGATWTMQTIPDNLYAAVAWNGSVFVAVGYGVAATSPDGATWTIRTVPAGNYTGLAWDGTRFVAVGPGAAATSPDGITWTARALPPGAFHKVAWAGALFTAVGQRPQATGLHVAEEAIGPVTAACLGCHANGVAKEHAAAKTAAAGGVESCGTCHGANGAQSSARVHSVP